MKIISLLICCFLLFSALSVVVFADESAPGDVSHYVPDDSEMSQTELTIAIIFMIVLISVVGVLFAKTILKNKNSNRLGRR